MKLILLFALVFAFGTAYGSENLVSRLSAVRRVARSIPQPGLRIKRQTFTQYFCIRRCTTTYSMKEDMEMLDNDNIGKVFDEDGPEKLQQICDKMSDMRACIDACGHFPQKEQVMRPFRIVDYICKDNYDEFIEQMPCFQQSNDAIDKKCDPKCGGKKFQEEQQKLLKRYEAMGDIFGMLRVLKKTCTSASCRIDCQGPVMEEVCGDRNAVQLLNGFAKIAMEEAKHLFTVGGIESLFPEECDRVIETAENGAAASNQESEENDDDYIDNNTVEVNPKEVDGYYYHNEFV